MKNNCEIFYVLDVTRLIKNASETGELRLLVSPVMLKSSNGTIKKPSHPTTTSHSKSSRSGLKDLIESPKPTDPYQRIKKYSEFNHISKTSFD